MGLPLASIRVVDLTRFRSGPTAVRQLADMGAQVIQVVAPGEGRGGASAFGVHGFDYQNVQRNKRSLRLNLRDARGREVLLRLARRADVLVENFRPGVTARLGIDYETLRGREPAPDLRQHLGLRPGWAVPGPARLRPGGAGHGRADVDHGRAGRRAHAGRHPGRRPDRRDIPGAGHPGGADRAGAVGRGAVGDDVAAAGDGQHARLPGDALADRRRGPAAGRQRSPHDDADRGVPVRRRADQHRGHDTVAVARPVHDDRGRGAGCRTRASRSRRGGRRGGRRCTRRSIGARRRSSARR